MRWRISALPLVLLLGGTFAGTQPSTAASASLGFDAPVVMPFSWGTNNSGGGSEPSIALSRTAQLTRKGLRYNSWQSPGEVARSLNGASWRYLGQPDPGNGGDETMAVDAAGAAYLGQFCGDEFELHNCILKTLDGGKTWEMVEEFADRHPGAADRPWIDVYPKYGANWDTNKTDVYLEYHTFSPEELAYVTVSHDGGQTFSEPKMITTDTNALVSSGCNTVPGGVTVDQRTGTVYAIWLSGNDVESNAQTGCNYTQIGPFNKAWVSVSHDRGETWESHLAWQGDFNEVTKVGDNADKIFATINVDRAGQVHVILPVRHKDDPVTFTATGDEDPQATDLLLVTSPDEGQSWTPPEKLNQTEGSYFFPWSVGGSGGIFDVVYYRSPTLTPNDPSSVWYIGVSQVRNAIAVADADGGAHFASTPTVIETTVDPEPVHRAGICTFGLFCAAVPGANRNLADSIGIDLDPNGGANISYTVDAEGALTLRGHGHSEYPTGLVHLAANVKDPLDAQNPAGSVAFRDDRNDPPGSAKGPITCYGTARNAQIFDANTVRIDGTVTCDGVNGATTFAVVVTDNGPNPPNSDEFRMTLFDGEGSVVYDVTTTTTVGLGDLLVTAAGQVSDREDSHIEYACQSSGPSAYANRPALTGCFAA